MAWRVVAIENPAKLSFKDNKLIVKQEDEVSLPLEDIDSLIIDNREVILTTNIISALSHFGVNTIVCDDKHLPSTVILPHGQASRGSKNARMQLNMGEALRKQLWRNNIIQKIKNQAIVLRKNGFDTEANHLDKLAATVRSGDAGNNESIAARIYFGKLLDDATRRKPLWHNSALNYGYAIVRGALAREVTARGLVTEIGINHHSELNQYNLVDDLIETFRPIVDDYIISIVALFHIGDEHDSSLNKDDRHKIIDIINQYGIMLDKRYTIKHLAGMTVESFINAISEDDAELLALPSVIR